MENGHSITSPKFIKFIFTNVKYPIQQCDRQNNGPSKIVHIIILRTYDYLILHRKRDLADVIKGVGN